MIQEVSTKLITKVRPSVTCKNCRYAVSYSRKTSSAHIVCLLVSPYWLSYVEQCKQLYRELMRDWYRDRESDIAKEPEHCRALCHQFWYGSVGFDPMRYPEFVKLISIIDAGIVQPMSSAEMCCDLFEFKNSATASVTLDV